jgi:uncharacterized membrane protein
VSQTDGTATLFRLDAGAALKPASPARQAWRCVLCSSSPGCLRLPAACLTGRSSGPPPARPLGREALRHIMRLAAQAPCRRRPLSSNVMRRTGLTVAFLLSFGVAAYAIAMYGFGPGAERLHPEMRAAFESHPIGIKTHIFASALALLLGPFQFSARLRLKRPALHRWLGRVYLGVAVSLGGAAGLYMSQYAFGGPFAKLGFAGLAIAWLFTGARAFMAARNRDFPSHRRWMIRNFALTFAAVTLRLYLPPVFIVGLPFATSYAIIAWLCWVPNLFVAEWFAKTTHNPSLERTSTGKALGPRGAQG